MARLDKFPAVTVEERNRGSLKGKGMLRWRCSLLEHNPWNEYLFIRRELRCAGLEGGKRERNDDDEIVA